MSNSADLLRLLEPIVRPVTNRAGPAPSGQIPFEAQNFDTLLTQAARQPTPPDPSGSSAATAPADRVDKYNTLARLSGPGSIENQSLRNLIASHQHPGANALQPSPTES